jgi:hypothetical protein
MTEKSYIDSLLVMKNLYYEPLLRSNIISRVDVERIFSSGVRVLDVNTAFTVELEQRLQDDNNSLADVLFKLTENLDVYLQFVNMYDAANERVERLKESVPQFARFLDEAKSHARSKMLPLHAHLITPIQRIPRYVMLFTELLKATPSTHADSVALVDVDKRMRAFADLMNERKRERDNDQANRVLAAQIDGLDVRLAESGRALVKRGAATSDARDVVILLFNDILLCCVPLKNDRLQLLW